MTTFAETTEITIREHQLRVTQEDATLALGRVMNEPAVKARAKLRFGPGRTCEQLARMLDKALVRAEENGIQLDTLILSAGRVVAAEDIVRVRRKAHGLSDWISSSTSDVMIRLSPVGVQASAIVAAAASERVDVVSQATPIEETPVELAVREALSGVLDPDLGVNIVDLGFVRRVNVGDDGVATITMTLTSPACPLAKVMTNQMRTVMSEMNTEFNVEWEWKPSWRPEDITPAGREQLEAIGFNAFKIERKACTAGQLSHDSNSAARQQRAALAPDGPGRTTPRTIVSSFVIDHSIRGRRAADASTTIESR